MQCRINTALCHRHTSQIRHKVLAAVLSLSRQAHHSLRQIKAVKRTAGRHAVIVPLTATNIQHIAMQQRRQRLLQAAVVPTLQKGMTGSGALFTVAHFIRRFRGAKQVHIPLFGHIEAVARRASVLPFCTQKCPAADGAHKHLLFH